MSSGPSGERKNPEARGFSDFLPDELVRVEDETSVLYNPSVHLPADEARARLIATEQWKPPAGMVERDGNAYRIVYGRKRNAAYRRANEIRAAEGLGAPLRQTMKVQRFDGHDGGDLARLQTMFAENGVTPEAPMTRAFVIHRLLEKGQTPEQVGALIGMGAKPVKNYHRLLDLSPKWQRAVDSGTSMTTALEAAALPRAKQDELYDKMKTEGTLKGDAAVTRVRAAAGKPARPSDKPRMMTRAEIETWRGTETNRDTLAVLDRILGNMSVALREYEPANGTTEHASA